MSTTPLPQDEAFISLHELLQALCHDSVYGDDMSQVANTLIRKRFGELRPPVAWVRRKPSGELVIAPDEPSKIEYLLWRVVDW